MKIESRIADELGVRLAQVESAVNLLDEGATVPFISRYRKVAPEGWTIPSYARCKTGWPGFPSIGRTIRPTNIILSNSAFNDLSCKYVVFDISLIS